MQTILELYVYRLEIIIKCIPLMIERAFTNYSEHMHISYNTYEMKRGIELWKICCQKELS